MANGGPSGRRVALLTPFYWPEVRRGTERLVHDLASGISGSWSPLIAAGHPGPGSRSAEDGADVVRLRRLPEGLARAFGYPEPLGHLPALWLALRRENLTLVHSFGAYEAAVAQHAARRRDVAKVLTVTGIPQRAVAEGRLWRRRAIRRAIAGSDAVVVLSHAARDALGWLGGEQRVIAPGVDLAAFRRTGERAPNPTFVCTAAPDDPRKRVDLVVEAFGEVQARWADARLILSRRGADAQRLAGPGIELRDLDSHPALVAAYSEAWGSVLASRAEAFGLVAVESLACETPVVASADAGIAEAVGGEGRHARLFSGEAPSAVAKLMIDTAEAAADQRVPDACRRQAERFSLDRCVEAYLSLYAELSGS